MFYRLSNCLLKQHPEARGAAFLILEKEYIRQPFCLLLRTEKMENHHFFNHFNSSFNKKYAKNFMLISLSL
jgi:hypothetical protein